MMQTFRNSAKVAGAIFALLMLIFVLTSVDWSGLTKSTSVGKINGQSVDARTYPGGSCSRRIDNRQRRSPASLTLEERHQIEDQVWEQFVQNRVLETEYERRGITVIHDEIVQAIRNSPPADFRNVPEFQTDSQFDIDKYQRWLTSSVGAPVSRRRWRRSTATRCAAPSCSEWSRPTCTSPTPRSGSSTVTRTSR